ncbi:MAG: cbb3-type cytochrome oxidase assembly protein CcoS [Candidatus Methanoperedens sp.]|nr:cbb3-type cytochrome oxidase assembly protein CcoS [Candidatus Methanoperedens sp.]
MLGDHLMPDGQVMSGGASVDYQIILIASVAILLIFPLLLLWGWRKGQFRDIEEAKYRMMEMEEEHND